MWREIFRKCQIGSRLEKLRFLSGISALLFVGGACDAMARTDEPWCAGLEKQLTQPRIRLDEERPFLFHLGPLRFAVPWKYLGLRPPVNLPSCTMETEAFGIVFWISDGEAPESDTSRLIGFSPAEANRVPNPEASLIKVKSVTSYAGHAPSHYSPDAVVANLTERYGRKTVLNRDGDLTSIRSSEYPDHLADWYRLGEDASIFVTCFGPDDTSVCRNFLDLKDKHLFVSFLSTLRAVRHNAVTISTLRDLLRKWEAAY